MKVAIFPGHVGKDSGAIDRAHDNDELHTIEAVISGQVSALLKNHLNQLGINSGIFNGSFTSRIACSKGCDVGISLHCDSFTDPNVNGYTVYHYPGHGMRVQCAQILDEQLKVNLTPFIRSRGVKTHPYHILEETVFPCVLLEMGFVSNKSDEMALNDYKMQMRIVHSIASMILSF